MWSVMNGDDYFGGDGRRKHNGDVTVRCASACYCVGTVQIQRGGWLVQHERFNFGDLAGNGKSKSKQCTIKKWKIRHLKTVDTIRFHPTQRFNVAVQVCLRNKQSVKVTTGAYVVQHSGRLRSFFRLSTRAPTRSGSWTKWTFGTVEQTLTTKVLGLLEIAICVVATWERIGVKANINGMAWFRFFTKESLLLVSRNVNNGLELLGVCAKWVKV